MKPLLLALLLAVLPGCAFLAGTKNPEDTSFMKASEGEASGVAKTVTGNSKYCMAQVHSSTFGVKVRLVYTPDGGCQIQAGMAQ